MTGLLNVIDKVKEKYKDKEIFSRRDYQAYRNEIKEAINRFYPNIQNVVSVLGSLILVEDEFAIGTDYMIVLTYLPFIFDDIKPDVSYLLSLRYNSKRFRITYNKTCCGSFPIFCMHIAAGIGY